MIAQATAACNAVSVGVGGAIVVECANQILGIPREVLWAALAGACAGLAQRKSADWDGFLRPVVPNRVVSIAIRSIGLAFTISANALICAWIAQLMQHLTLTEGVAKALPMAFAGGLAWSSQRLLPALLDRVESKIKEDK